MTGSARKITKVLAQAAVVALAVSSMASAQSFSFGAANMAGAPGETVNIPIYVQGAGDVAGVNYTVRISSADGAKLGLASATSSSGLATGNFTYAMNSLTRSGATGGSITGDVVEHRGVLYSTVSPAQTFNAAGQTQVATIQATIDPGATGSVMLELVSAIDNNTGLLGISDASGNSVVPGGQQRPGGATMVLDISAGGFPVTTDFQTTGSDPNWTYVAILPAGGSLPVGTAVPGEGAKIEGQEMNSFGFWFGHKDNPASIWRKPQTGMIYVTDFTMKSDATGFDIPPIRIRTDSGDSFYASYALFQDLPGNGADGVQVVPDSTPKTMRLLNHVQSTNNNGIGPDGFNVAADLFLFLLGAPNEGIYLQALKENVVDPATLSGETVIYDHTFVGADPDIFVHEVENITGKPVTYSINDGLGIQTSGTYEAGTGIFSFGFWYSTFGQLAGQGLVGASNKWYKIEATVAGDASVPSRTPVIRLRLSSESLEWMYYFTMTAAAGDTSMAATPAGVTYTSWAATPPEIDGLPLAVAFEMYDIYANVPDENPTVRLKSLKITQYNAPVLP